VRKAIPSRENGASARDSRSSEGGRPNPDRRSPAFRVRRGTIRFGDRRLFSLVLGDDLYPSVEIVDEHLAGSEANGAIRGVFDRLVEVPEPFDVVAAAPKPPAVRLLDDPNEEGHALSVDAITQSGAGPKVPSLSFFSGSRSLGTPRGWSFACAPVFGRRLPAAARFLSTPLRPPTPPRAHVAGGGLPATGCRWGGGGLRSSVFPLGAWPGGSNAGSATRAGRSSPPTPRRSATSTRRMAAAGSSA